MKHTRTALISQLGFSLAETIISVGITSSALLAVVGLLSSNLNSARDSRSETAAGVLARRLAAETVSRTAGAAALPAAPPHIILVNGGLETMASTAQGDEQLAAAYEQGDPRLDAAYFGRVDRFEVPGEPLLSRLVIAVESPANAPAGQRKVHRYVTLSSN